MSDKLPFFAAEANCTYSTSSPNPHVNLSGTAASFGTYPVCTFAAAAADTAIDFDSGHTCTVTIWKDASNYKRYSGAVWTDASPDTIDLSAATLEASLGSIANNDSVTVAASDPKVDSARTWATAQAFAAGFSGGVATVASAGTAQTVSLDGKIHAITLDNASSCTITGSPVGSAYSSALLLLKQDSSGSHAFAFASGTKELATQTLNTSPNKYSAWVLWSHDGSTVFASPAGKEA